MKEKEGAKTVERVEVFNFSEKSTPVRVQVINGEPWFVAKDIAEALGYSNPRKAINDHCKEKGVTFRDSLTEGGVQKLKYINEGNFEKKVCGGVHGIGIYLAGSPRRLVPPVATGAQIETR